MTKKEAEAAQDRAQKDEEMGRESHHETWDDGMLRVIDFEAMMDEEDIDEEPYRDKGDE